MNEGVSECVSVISVLSMLVRKRAIGCCLGNKRSI